MKNKSEGPVLSREDITDMITMYDAFSRMNNERFLVQPYNPVYGSVDLEEQLSRMRELLWRKISGGCDISSCTVKNDMDKLFTCSKREFFSLLDVEDLSAGERCDFLINMEFRCGSL